MNQIPTVQAFNAASIEQVRQVVPDTVIVGAGGTRRRAVLAGIPPRGEDYVIWTRQEMLACLGLLFRYGVKHVLAPLLVHGHKNERTPGYSENVVGWIRQGLADGASLRDYERRGWRVRLIGAESWPGLQSTAAELRLDTAHNPGPTVWFSVLSNVDAHWEYILRLALEHGVTTRADMVRLVYGEDVPPASLYLGTGKPQVVESIVPPLLIGKLECYWRQHLGYDLDERTLRAILYDYAFVRRPTQEDKSGRAEQVLDYAGAWEEPPIIGMGMRLGPFWYPAPTPAPQFQQLDPA